MKHSVASLWLTHMHGNGPVHTIRDRLPTETPNILSVIGTRQCDLRCRHCIFPHGDTVPTDAETLRTAVESIARQMPSGFALIHEGRTFALEHLSWLKSVRRSRPDACIGLIDNGSFVRHLSAIRDSGFRFDWLDISLDGPEEIHNRQRRSEAAFREACVGIESAHDILVPETSVNILTTLTALNHDALEAIHAMLPGAIETWHVTTVTPARPELRPLSVTALQFEESWKQLRRIRKHRPVTLKFYWTDDLPKLIHAVGQSTFESAFSRAAADASSVRFEIDGIEIRYFPHSIAPRETFVVDADGQYRLPYANAYSLRELQTGISRFSEDLTALTVDLIEPKHTLSDLYQKCAKRWIEGYFEPALKQEVKIFKQHKRFQRR